MAHLVSQRCATGSSPVEAVAVTLPRLRGAFALVFLFAGEDDLLIGARHGAPLAIGYGEGEMYLGSDALALAPFTDDITYLEDGDWACCPGRGADIRDADGEPVERPRQKIPAGAFMAEKGNHRHFMAKEIHEQPEVVGRTLAHYVDFADGQVCLPFDAAVRLRGRCSARVDLGLRHRLSTPGSSANTGSSAWRACRSRSTSPRSSATARRRWSRAAWRCSSRNRARRPTRWPRCATPRQQGQHVLSVVNVPTSTIARESDVVAPTLAGPEIGVASTKAFTCQLAVLAVPRHRGGPRARHAVGRATKRRSSTR